MANGDDTKKGGIDINPQEIKAGTDAQQQATKAINDATKALNEEAEAIRNFSDSAKPAAENAKLFGRASERLAQEQKTLSSILKRSKEDLKKWAEQTYGVEAAAQKVTNSIKSMHGELDKLFSLTNFYKRRLEEIREGQEAFSSSMLASSANVGKASRGLQNSIDLVRESYSNAGAMMRKYNISLEEGRKIGKAVNTQFQTQIQASKNMGKALKGMSEDVLVVSKRMGVDASEAMNYMQQRLETSDKTLGEVRDETMLVAKATDQYIASLTKMGLSLEKANVHQRDLFKALQAANKEFEFGSFDASAWMKAMAPLNAVARQAGLNTTEIRAMNDSMAKFMSSMQDADLGNIFGVKTAQDVAAMMERMEQFGGEATRKRLSFVRETAAKQGMDLTNPQVLRQILAAARGSPEMQQMVLQRAMEIGSAPMREIMKESFGKNELGLSVVQQNLGKLADSFGQSAKEQGSAEGEAQKAREDMNKLLANMQNPIDATDKATLETYNTLKSIENFLSRNLWAQIIGTGVKLAAQAVIFGYQLRTLKQIERNTAGGGLGGDGGGGGGRRRPRRGRRGRKVRFSRARQFARRHGGKAAALTAAAGLLGIGIPAGAEPYISAGERVADVGSTAGRVASVTGKGAETASKAAAEASKAAAKSTEAAAKTAAEASKAAAKEAGELSKWRKVVPPGGVAPEMGALKGAAPTLSKGAKFAKYGGKALKFGGKALGPIGAVVSAAFALPDLYKRLKAAEDAEDVAGAALMFMGDFTGGTEGAKFWQWVDKKTGGKFGDITDKLDTSAQLEDAAQKVAAKAERKKQPAHFAMGTVGSGIRGIRGKGGAKSAEDLVSKLQAKIGTTKLGSKYVERAGGLQAVLKRMIEGKYELMKAPGEEHKDAYAVDYLLKQMESSAELRGLMAESGITPEQLLKAGAGPTVTPESDLGRHVAWSKATGQAPSAVASELMKEIAGRREAAAGMTIGMDPTLMRQAASPQEGKYNPMSKTMTYNMVIPFAFKVDQLATATADAMPTVNKKTNSTPG